MVTTNAALVEIRGAGEIDRSGDTTPDGPVLWAGTAAGYLKRKRRTVISGGQQVRDDIDVFTILDTAGAPVLEAAGPDWEAATIVVDDQRTGTTIRKRFTVDAMEHRAAGTIADSVRCELSGETTV